LVYDIAATWISCRPIMRRGVEWRCTMAGHCKPHMAGVRCMIWRDRVRHGNRRTWTAHLGSHEAAVAARIEGSSCAGRQQG